ncbi:MAG TPA: M20/M25/M40 family metallo-hydrolase [Solirubrobacteraceae bacterium]|nr:M20/M25/M40 family metallo-hydrolase [Solirubrobacteraceae bacterium]
MSDLQAETTEVLQALVRFNTVNPPGNERPAMEYLEAYLREAGFFTELLGAHDSRPNLVATLDSGEPGPAIVYLGHVDTVLADPEDWTFDPWSGEISGNHLWGRGALDMKSQVAAEAVAAASLAREGWRPARGALKLVFVVDEETGGALGARWLTEQHPDKVRCDFLLNEGGGAWFEYGGRRLYGLCCGEKSVIRFEITARGAAGHASLPRAGDNALLKLAPVLSRLATRQPGFDLIDGSRALLDGLGENPADPARAMQHILQDAPALAVMVEPMLGVTLAPTMAHASDKVNVIPARARLRVDCRVPPGLGEDVAVTRLHEVLGDVAEGLEIEITESQYANVSTPSGLLMEAIEHWVKAQDPDASIVPVLLPGFSDSSWFRTAFPDVVAYGFFPQRHQSLLEIAPLVHNADERIDVRDVGFATEFFVDMARTLLH